MDEHMQEAIETVDNARQHKCELEEKRSLLKKAIEQVEHSAELSRREIARYFDELKANVIKACESKADKLMKEVNEIEHEALSPLIDCRTLVQEGIDEAETVVMAGDKLLHDDCCDSEVHQKEFTNFTDMASNIALDSVPEVPSLVEVVCISAILDETLPKMLVQTLKAEGSVSRRAPVQLSDLQARPGGILMSWQHMDDDNDSIDDDDDDDEEVNVLYKLQSCVGKPTTVFKNGRALKETSNFKDEYVGPLSKYLVRGITPNTMYTFRVCCCKCSLNNDAPKIWSPWSIYQQKLTTMPPHQWALTKESGEAYSLSNKQQTVSKSVKRELAIYTKPSENLLFFPVTFRIEAAGKTRGPSDCFAVCFKRDLDASNLHLKEGTFCFHSDGTVWVNGKASKTRFANFYRGMVMSFLIEDTNDNHSGFKKSSKTTNTTRYCVVLSLGDREAVFYWQPFKNMTPCPIQDLCLGLMFKSPGWKVTIL